MSIDVFADCDLCEGTGSIVLNGMIGGCYKCQQRWLKECKDQKTQAKKDNDINENYKQNTDS